MPAAICRPGNSPGTITVNGNLTLAAGAVTTIEVQAAIIDRINVTGTANLNGTLQLAPLGGPYQFGTPYTFVQAGTLLGTFATISTQGSFGAGVAPTVTYTDTLVQLTLNAAALTPIVQPAGATRNQLAIAAGFDNAVITLGRNGSPFLPVFDNTPAGILVGLTQLSGEVHTGAGPLGTLAASQFLSLLASPFDGTRVGGGTAPAPATAYAPFRKAGNVASDAIEIAADLAGAPPAAVEEKRYRVWGALTGGGGPISGDRVVGSNRRTETNYGAAAGTDITLLPNLTAGFALSGGQADARLANGLGTLGADVFQAGLYARSTASNVRLGAALAYTYLDLDSNRSVPVLGITSLNARYGAHGVSGRLEAAYTLWTQSGLSLSPVAAIQGSYFRIDGFTETAGPIGGVVAASLTAAGRDQASLRGEAGLQIDSKTSIANLPAEAFIRAAWGIYGLRDATLTARLAGLAGSTFTVTGAQNDVSTALVAAGLDVKLTADLTLSGRFDGEYGARTSRSTGSARLKLAF